MDRPDHIRVLDALDEPRARAENNMKLPAALWLSRKSVLAVVGNWRRLRALEASGALHRRVGLAGLKRARYHRDEVLRCADLTVEKPLPKPSA